MRKKQPGITLTFAVTIAAAFAPPLIAPPAVVHADTPEQVYLNLLTQAGVGHPDDAAAIQAGNEICAQLRAGVDPGVIEDKISAMGFDNWRTGAMVGATGHAGSLCPDTWWVQKAWTQKTLGNH